MCYRYTIFLKYISCRDAIAKAIYSRLFTWLVERINNIVCNDSIKQNSIAILDIFGFEVLLFQYIQPILLINYMILNKEL